MSKVQAELDETKIILVRKVWEMRQRLAGSGRAGVTEARF